MKQISDLTHYMIITGMFMFFAVVILIGFNKFILTPMKKLNDQLEKELIEQSIALRAIKDRYIKKTSNKYINQ